MADLVIGLDFGNCNTYPSYIDGMDERRSGGTADKLLDPGLSQRGIPSRFFYEEGLPEPIVGMQLSDHNIEETRGVNLIKRHLGESFLMGGRVFQYNEAARLLIQHSIREASRYLEEMTLERTNLVSLAYPVTYSSAQRKKLVEIVESTTLEDGTGIKVVGTIMEPAAAALDVLSGALRQRRDMTVLVYDLGGGTFDATILSAFPEGHRNSAGDLCYYAEHLSEGIDDLGGEDFTDAVKRIIETRIRAAGVTPPANQLYRDHLAEQAELTKIKLSTVESFTPTFYEVPTGLGAITRAEFERMTLPLLRRTINVITNMLDRCDPTIKPKKIIMTGGASNMPMARRELKSALKAYGYSDSDIALYRPNLAVSYGAARFGVVESDNDLHVVNGRGANTARKVVKPVLIQKLRRDIGIRFYRGGSEQLYIETLLPRGTEIPNRDMAFTTSHPHTDGQIRSIFPVFEAKVENPSIDNWERDWVQIGNLTLDHGRPVPTTFTCYSRLVIDADGTLRVEAYNEDGKDAMVHKDLDWTFEEAK